MTACEEIPGQAARRGGSEACGDHHRRALGLGILLAVQLLEVTRSEELVEKTSVVTRCLERFHFDQRTE
jgi:hypothetical protein